MIRFRFDFANEVEHEMDMTFAVIGDNAVATKMLETTHRGPDVTLVACTTLEDLRANADNLQAVILTKAPNNPDFLKHAIALALTNNLPFISGATDLSAQDRRTLSKAASRGHVADMPVADIAFHRLFARLPRMIQSCRANLLQSITIESDLAPRPHDLTPAALLTQAAETLCGDLITPSFTPLLAKGTPSHMHSVTIRTWIAPTPAETVTALAAQTSERTHGIGLIRLARGIVLNSNKGQTGYYTLQNCNIAAHPH